MSFVSFQVFFVSLVLFCDHFSEESSFSKMSFLKLDGSIIQAIAVPDIFQCCWKCDRLPECFSLNVADVPDKDGLYECQMLRNETNKYSGLLKPSQHYHHYTRFTDSSVCDSVQCLSGGICHPEGNSNFRCSCPQSFTGKFCQFTKEYKWLKINNNHVCFGAKDSAFGRFHFQRNGTVYILKLVHRSGYVTCLKSRNNTRSNWGCAGSLEYLNTIITNSKDQKILPEDKFMVPNTPNLSYRITGFTSKSPELVFENFTIPLVVTADQEYRLWYGEDLKGSTEHDNEGRTCVDVYVFGLFD